jgi:hypothetical protein
MKSPIYNYNQVSAHAIKLLFAALALTYTVAAMADQNSAGPISTEPYVDSVTQWGAWELDIEPAAGGLNKPATQALKARSSKLTVRTNSFSAVGPQAPVTPPRPPTRPEFGGPSDGFF